MASKTIQLMLSRAAVANNRFFGAKCNLESPDVPRLAETARISLTPQVVEEFAPKIRQVVDCQLQAVDLQSVEPAIRADTEGDNLRDDVPETFSNRDAIIAAVPTYEDSYIKVPKVLNKNSFLLMDSSIPRNEDIQEMLSMRESLFISQEGNH